jgi:ATP:corrinoid adenosyltransferase
VTVPPTTHPPRPPRGERPPRRDVDSLLLVPTGHGKGKSTAASGTAPRARRGIDF